MCDDPHPTSLHSDSIMDAKRETTGLTHDVSDLNYALEGDQKPVHSLLLRIDWRILPIMFLTYFLQFLDKVCLNVSLIFNVGIPILTG